MFGYDVPNMFKSDWDSVRVKLPLLSVNPMLKLLTYVTPMLYLCHAYVTPMLYLWNTYVIPVLYFLM